ncbi:uncharacterized protein BO95DRAFT_464306 [Aspergillus brunneoviolaceus CBS 621.78]|uniref:Uncharacterized protein n=1 Tax=Aspergillus brunneoviolaceus CBS 621.78 TaxID=1450534 RepID=A0ACD1G7I2_9EURO|nr:hypothetical protein BO95DRAFT_464306 [Aspergillus brunneoviolaceus CBS 621.78]RAH45237.1 hypothetical protein BO95DRAFT_464306 [Aspergillus brunneoviolaceus CBS 621.78]
MSSEPPRAPKPKRSRRQSLVARNHARYEKTRHLTPYALLELDLRQEECVAHPVRARTFAPEVYSHLSEAQRAHLRQLAEDGGPDLSDLRGYPRTQPTKSPGPTAPASASASASHQASTLPPTSTYTPSIEEPSPASFSPLNPSSSPTSHSASFPEPSEPSEPSPRNPTKPTPYLYGPSKTFTTHAPDHSPLRPHHHHHHHHHHHRHHRSISDDPRHRRRHRRPRSRPRRTGSVLRRRVLLQEARRGSVARYGLGAAGFWHRRRRPDGRLESQAEADARRARARRAWSQEDYRVVFEALASVKSAVAEGGRGVRGRNGGSRRGKGGSRSRRSGSGSGSGEKGE